MGRDNPYSSKHHEIEQNSDINFLNIGDKNNVTDGKKNLEAQRLNHEQINSQISAAHQTVKSIVDRLAAYYPNGHQGVLDTMVKGPAQDEVVKMLKRNQNTSDLV